MVEISLVRRLTGREFLEEIEEEYGGVNELEKYVEKNPDDPEAELDLLDAEYFKENPRERDKLVERGEIRIPWSEDDLKKLTPKRLELLGKLKETDVRSIKNLASLAGRDYKNVHDDVEVMEHLGLLNLEKRGRTKVPRLTFEEIEIKI